MDKMHNTHTYTLHLGVVKEASRVLVNLWAEPPIPEVCLVEGLGLSQRYVCLLGWCQENGSPGGELQHDVCTDQTPCLVVPDRLHMLSLP
jgi:hypothetical protein